MTRPDDLEATVRRSLHEQAEAIQPAEDGLAAIRARTSANEGTASRERPWFAMGSAALATAATITAVAVLAPDPTGQEQAAEPAPAAPPVASEREEPEPEPDREPVPPESSEAETVGPAAKRETVPVYYLGDTGLGPRLFREFHQVRTDDVAEAALDEALGQPPVDPDYYSPWPGRVDVRSVRHAGALITVDLSGPASLPDSVTARAQQVVLQQLVYTVQGALQSTDPVQFLVDGEPVDDLLGVPSRTPVERADPLGTQSPIWIIEPGHGATMDRQVEFGGVANTYEANVAWQVLENGDVIEHGAATAEGGMGTFSRWSAEVDLPPGDYTLRAYETSAEDGSLVAEDTKAFTVR